MKVARYVLLGLLVSATAGAAGVTHYPLFGGSKFPIARAVKVPGGTTLYFLSGEQGGPTTRGAPWGDTETQTVRALKGIQRNLKSLGLSFGDVVSMTAYMVAPPGSSRLDFAGFMKGYTQFFGTKQQPNLPSRTALQVAGLAGTGQALIEIAVVGAKHTR